MINVGSNISVAFTEFDYYLQPWTLEYLNKLLNNGKMFMIIILNGMISKKEKIVTYGEVAEKVAQKNSELENKFF